MAYRNDSESPTTSSGRVTLNTVSDNGGSDNGANPTGNIGIFSTVTVVGINDAPVLAGGRTACRASMRTPPAAARRSRPC
jgi:hypothetical protein